MTYLVLALICFLVFSVYAGSSIKIQKPKINFNRLLDAISAVENWNGKDGKSGEKGPYQITHQVWNQYTMLDFTDNNVKQHGKEIALCHLDWIYFQLKKNNLPETAFAYAAAWNAGWNSYFSGTYSLAKEDYAKRVQNIYISN